MPSMIIVINHNGRWCCDGGGNEGSEGGGDGGGDRGGGGSGGGSGEGGGGDGGGGKQAADGIQHDRPSVPFFLLLFDQDAVDRLCIDRDLSVLTASLLVVL